MTNNSGLKRDRCIHNIRDGAGNYCLLLPRKPEEENYPHKYHRTECYGLKHDCRIPESFALPNSGLSERDKAILKVLEKLAEEAHMSVDIPYDYTVMKALQAIKEIIEEK